MAEAKKPLSLHAQDRGGPLNLTGIHYQLLATFREMALPIHVRKHDGKGNRPPTTITLVIEPRGGGDSAVSLGAVRRVQQIKTRKGTWSFPQIVKRVLPDLFRAYCNDPGVAGVELVTNGHLDAKASQFSKSLDALLAAASKAGLSLRSCAEANDLLAWFTPKTRSSGKQAAATFADLIDHLAVEIPQEESSTEAEHRKKVERFLGRLSLRTGISFADQETPCREFLLGWGIAPEAVGRAMNQVVGYLLGQGQHGNRAVTFGDLALELGLAERDLSNWSLLGGLSRDRLLTDLARARPGYREDQDVRRSDPLSPEMLRITSVLEADQTFTSPTTRPPPNDQLQPIVVWGKSGIGKTWLLARAACLLARAPTLQKPILVWLSSRQDARVDLESAAQKFCHGLWGHETSLPMELLAQRVRRIAAPESSPWLVVFIDGVQSAGYLDSLGELLHSELGVLLVIGVTAEIHADSAARPGMRLLQAPSFTPDEVLCFLESRVPISIGLPPKDVRRLLETPIFCAIYASLKQSGSAWQPENEYELVQHFWLERIARPRPQAADVLARLTCTRMRAATTTNDRPSQGQHSWTVAELRTVGLSQADLDALEGSAVVARDQWSRSYSFSHERILQWSAAEGALRAFQAEELHSEELAQLCVAILTGDSQARWVFGYFPADLLWLLLDPELPKACRSAAETFLAELERHQSFSRFQDWLATLGVRLVPLLFARLRSAGQGDTITRYTYRDALKKIQGSEVAKFSVGLLAEPSLDLQEIGVQLLGDREYPPALDPLWDLYRTWWSAAHTEQPATSGRREGPRGYHVSIGEKALRRSVRNRPDWLERRLLESESLEGERSTLLFLLGSTPKGETVWSRHKELLKRRLARDQQRGFVRCIISFRDKEEISWLESRVNETRDYVAPAARGALALLAPERALARADQEALMDLSLARGWWLPAARIQRPEGTSNFLRELTSDSEDPVGTLFSFSGFELWYPPEVIDFLLEHIQSALRQNEETPARDPLYAPLSQLSDCNTLDQLERIWGTRHSELESNLADWLIERAPNDLNWVRRGSEGEAGEVLRLMGGQGAARVGSKFLQRSVTWSGGSEGLDFAVREPSPESLAAIRSRALDSTLSAPPMATEHPILQCACITALAYLRDFEGFARGVVQWGLQLPPDLVSYLDDQHNSPQLLSVAEEALQKNPIPPGALMLLGFHGGTKALATLMKQQSAVFGSADLEVAWILGLDYSGDCSGRILSVFEKGLTSADDRIFFCSWQALLHRIENPRAQELLLAAVDRDHKESVILAARLLEAEPLKRQVAEHLWQRPKDKLFLLQFASHFEDFAVLGATVKEFLEIQAAGTMNPRPRATRYSAIRGLALFDRKLALRAALVCRKEDRASEDFEWPALWLEVGGLEALAILRSELTEQRELTNLHAIGEALRGEGQTKILPDWLQYEDSRVREGACYAACAQAYEPQLEQALIRCCLDPEEDVRTAAQAAYDCLWRDREVVRLVERLHREPRSGHRWALIDSALAIGYPGVRSGFGQIAWFSELVRNRPYYEVKYAAERLKRRRKELIEDLKQKSKYFRADA